VMNITDLDDKTIEGSETAGMSLEDFTGMHIDAFHADLKTLGAHNVTAGRQRGLTGKGRLQAMVQAYESYRRDGRLPASYEVVYGHAWAPQQRTQDGVTCIPLDGLKLGR